MSWLPERVRRRIDGFETVMNCRWPTVQDIRLGRLARAALTGLSAWRYASGMYAWPFELEFAQRMVRLRQPRVESL